MSKIIVSEWLSVDTQYGITGSCSELRTVDENSECYTIEDPVIGYLSRIKVSKTGGNHDCDCCIDELNVVKSKSAHGAALTATRYKVKDENYNKQEFYQLVQDILKEDSVFDGINALEQL